MNQQLLIKVVSARLRSLYPPPEYAFQYKIGKVQEALTTAPMHCTRILPEFQNSESNFNLAEHVPYTIKTRILIIRNLAPEVPAFYNNVMWWNSTRDIDAGFDKMWPKISDQKYPTCTRDEINHDAVGCTKILPLAEFTGKTWREFFALLKAYETI